MKEIVEMLFCRGLLKVHSSPLRHLRWVSTHPPLCVLPDLRKHDGQDFRGLLPANIPRWLVVLVDEG